MLNNKQIQREKILIINNTHSSLDTLNEIFKDQYEVFDVLEKNIDENIEQIKATNIIVVVINKEVLLKDKINFYPIIAKIKDIGIDKNIPIIILSYFCKDGTEDTFNFVGVCDLIDDDFTDNKLLEKVKQLLHFTKYKQDIENKMQLLLNNIQLAVVLLEERPNGIEMVYVNNKFYDMFGIEKEKFDTSNKNIFDYISTKFNEDEIKSTFAKALRSNRNSIIQTEAIKNNNSIVKLTVRCIKSDNYNSVYPTTFLILNDITELVELSVERENVNRVLEYRMNHDYLTGLYKQECFVELVNKELLNYPENRYALVVFKINKFSTISLIFSRKIGDLVLKTFAGGLHSTYDKNCYYCRLSGDFFGLFIKKSELDEAKLLEFMLTVFDKTKINYDISIVACERDLVGEQLSLAEVIDETSSVAEFSGNENVSSIVHYADFNYEAISLKKNISTHMINAIDEHQFEMYLQPIFNITMNKVKSCEALVRWNHPTLGLLSPAKFISIFEENGFIIKLDCYMLEEACKYIKSREERGLEPIAVSVNISRRTIYNLDLINKLSYLIKKYDINSALLELEIVESVYAYDLEKLVNIIHELRSMGFKILMDDFGSGYSSLNVLKDLPVDILKIDMKFFVGLTENSKAALIIASVVDMGKKLNMEIVAEGVENQYELNFLRNINCDDIQGYFFSKPVPVAIFEVLDIKIPN
ncbi:MAG: GGDEF domain-containing phosphodiesterase [Bacilli bacterium]